MYGHFYAGGQYVDKHKISEVVK